MSKFLLIGLGNIGAEYAHTRHNIGFDVLDAFVIKHGGFFKMDRLAEVAEVKWKGKVFICIKPTTFMNLSGKAFKYWMDKEKVALENTLTIVDDLALPTSKIRLRASGSDAGHNGLKDIQYVGFDVSINGKYVSQTECELIHKILNLPHVEILYTGKWNQEIQDKFVFNNFIEGTKVPHEGIVIKHYTGERNKVAKVINPDYLIYGEKHNIGDSH